MTMCTLCGGDATASCHAVLTIKAEVPYLNFLVSRIALLEQALCVVEWQGEDCTCPVCGSREEQGHMKTCEIGRALQPVDGQKEES